MLKDDQLSFQVEMASSDALRAVLALLTVHGISSASIEFNVRPAGGATIEIFAPEATSQSRARRAVVALGQLPAVTAGSVSAIARRPWGDARDPAIERLELASWFRSPTGGLIRSRSMAQAA